VTLFLPFSNGWKNSPEIFQRLEKSSEKVPMIGKNGKNFSNGWKNGRKIFQ